MEILAGWDITGYLNLISERQVRNDMFQKNMELELFIEDMGVNGEGIGKLDGAAFFVKDAVIGDHVRVKIMKMKKRYGYARLLEVISPSPYRIQPLCACYRQCGGCQIQALEYAQQLKYKERKVRNNLERIGGLSIEGTEIGATAQGILFHPVIGMKEPFFYRNKAQFPIGTDKEGKIITGFYAARSHQIISNRKCCLGVGENQEILDIVVFFMEKYHVPPYDEVQGKGLVRHVLVRYGFATREIMVCLVLNGRKLPYADQLTQELRRIPGMTSIMLNVNDKNTNVILGDELINLWGQDYITDCIGDVKYQISALSFYQVNPVQTKKLYETALAFACLSGKEVVWDLYCGIGTISLFLAQRAKYVYGVEVVANAVDDAKTNARINGIENVEFFVGKVEEVVPSFSENDRMRPDVIVVDPPRKGCDQKCLETIVAMLPERVVYVSCDSATLARDLKYLCERGYEVREVQPVDMFPQTTHVESVCLLHRKDS